MNKYTIGDETMRRVFEPNGLTNVSDLQAVFDAVERALVGWQPIETAPKDYEPVWVADAENVELGVRKLSSRTLEPLDEWESAESTDRDGDRNPLDFTPTHWMARPAPPRA